MLGDIFDSTTVGFIVTAAILFAILCAKDVSLAMSATKSGFHLFLRYLILILAAMLVAAYVQALIPKELITAYLGKQSGLRGILVGTVIGGLTPGSPYAAMPFFAAIVGMGASIPTGVAMVCAWGLWSIGRLPFEAAVMGSKFTLIRVMSSIFLPIVAGLIAWFLQSFKFFAP
ncbi:MAG: permease [Firmicutes bacterium]|jgi:uncharacterized membrane protein YraQ (UPF0718 family)|nr:permease [Candidatus Fermentithermobacillaceae bacterium]